VSRLVFSVLPTLNEIARTDVRPAEMGMPMAPARTEVIVSMAAPLTAAAKILWGEESKFPSCSLKRSNPTYQSRYCATHNQNCLHANCLDFVPVKETIYDGKLDPIARGETTEAKLTSSQ
jgi:hypothetical protein